MKQLFFSLFLTMLGLHGSAQYVTTIVNDPLTQFRDALIFDARGNLYCADYPGSSVFKRTPGGTVSVFATGFDSPNGLAFNSHGELYVADNTGNHIYKLDSNGLFLDTINVTSPSGLIKSWDSDTIIFTTYLGNTIGKLAPDGMIVPWHGGGLLNGPVGLAYDTTGQLWAGNFTDRIVFQVHPDTVTYWATVPGPAVGDSWLGFIAYARGSLWGTSYNGHKLYRIDLSQPDSVEYFAGGLRGNTDGHVSTSRFNYPNGIIGSTTGDTLYVSDYGSGRLRMITPGPTVGVLVADPIEVLSITPNPVRDACIVQPTGGFQSASLRLIDCLGDTLLSFDNVEGETYQMKIGDLPAGIYYLVVDQDGLRSTTRLVKQ